MRVLVIGGGIGGLAAANFLHQKKIDCTVIERAPAYRAAGHFIALKAEGVKILERLHIKDAVAELAMPTSSAITCMRPSGHLLKRAPLALVDTTLGGFYTLRRADLSQVLYDSVKDVTDVRFGEQVTALEQDPKGVTVTFTSCASERFDVVVGADGVHSATRARLFGSVGEWPMGGSYVGLEVKCDHDLAAGEAHIYLGRGRVVIALPTGNGRLAGIVYHSGEDLRPRIGTPAAARDFFAREYGDFAAPVRAMFAAIDDEGSMFADVIAQVRLPSIVLHRVALLGDAATCPSFLSGMGSAAAMMAAETLATQLATEPNTRQALSTYERITQERAAGFRDSAMRMRRLVLGSNPFVSVVRNTALAAIPMSWLMGTAKKFYSPAA